MQHAPFKGENSTNIQISEIIDALLQLKFFKRVYNPEIYWNSSFVLFF